MTTTNEVMRLADIWHDMIAAAPAVACVTECEACFTPDACQLRGKCDHYSAEQLRIAKNAAPSVAPEPVEMRPYNPTEAMRWAAKHIDPALTHDHIRLLWCTMWSAYAHPPRAPLTKEILATHRPYYSVSEWAAFVGGVRFAEMVHGISAAAIGAAK